MARREPAQLAIVDYLQLMEAPAAARTGSGKSPRWSAASRPSPASSASRSSCSASSTAARSTGSDKRPRMSDARESGSVENDSDVAILIHREDYYDPDRRGPARRT